MATEILPDLWIAEKKIFSNAAFMLENKFELFINLSSSNNLELKHAYLRLGNRDLYEDNLYFYDKLDDFVKYIHHYLSLNKAVLIYSDDCMQRSPTLAAAYIMKYGKVGVRQACEYIQTKRTAAFLPKMNYYMTLQKYEKNICL